MKKRLSIKNIIAVAIAAMVMPLSAQVEVNYQKYPDYQAPSKGDSKLMVRKTRAGEKRPDRVNNAETKYFPTIFNQDGGSCGSASRISYMFNYEINALRDADASLDENVYPSHFTWLLTNSGSSKDGMAIANGIPNIVTYGGRTYSSLFGNQDCSDPDFGWMQGYDKWYSAMFNRLGRTANFPLSVETEEGREAVKNWLWNHNGDTDFGAGGVCGIGVASGGKWLKIPNTDTNNEIGVNGKYYVGEWGQYIDHALTIVGYDDRIEFDLDGNGIAGEVEKDEVGAWIIANSWGASWCNRGFIYCPYKNAVTAVNGSYYMPEVYYIRKNYRPLRTMKIEMEYTKRSELLLSAGISSDINADKPEKTIQFEHFKYAGDGDGNSEDALTPMLGRWKDGLHREPMEFGYDLTDLSAGFDTRKPLKYFFVIQSKISASGNGKVHNCSVIDYEFDENGVEFPCNIAEDGVKIKNLGGKTYISVVVTGEPLHAPRNLMLSDGLLTWDVPAVSTYELIGYNVYSDGEILTRLDKDATSYSPEGTNSLKLAAIYTVAGKEAESAHVEPTVNEYYGAIPEDNKTHSFQNSGFEIVDLFKDNMSAVTIEYWLNPTNCINYNQNMGPGWGSNFQLHTTNTAQLVVGWNTGARIETSANALLVKKWNHIAVVVAGTTMTAYINGENVGEVTSGNNGIGAFGNLLVGGTTSSTAINGTMDEFRVWNTARTQSEIRSMMYAEIADPANTPNLLVNINMNEDANGKIYDATGKYTVTQLTAGRHRTNSDNILFVDNRELTAAFAVPQPPYYSNSALHFTNTSSANAIRYEWNIDGKKYNVHSPDAIFDTIGEKNISLTVYDVSGNSATCEQKITVESLPLPVASFNTIESATVGKHISFVNTTTPAEGCRFEWSMPGADVESANTVNAAASYSYEGIYTITLKATNAAGTSTATKTIAVGNVTPKVDFEIKPSAVLKGEKVSLVDATKHSPTSWHWAVYDKAHQYVFTEQNCELTINDPGRYAVSLEASNAIGTGFKLQEDALLVCNADSKTGLNFRGESTETVTLNNPIDLQAFEGFTMDWWMNPKRNATPSHAIGSNMNDMLICSLSDGALSFSIKGTVYTSYAGYFVPGEWHHYALIFNNGDLYMYRDGKYFQRLFTRYITSTYPVLSEEKIKFGGSNGAMNAVIDEFRVWGGVLPIETVMQYANAPIEDVAAAEKEHNLVLYYQFNQSSGDVLDATSNGNNGIRSGFGPEGDAWSSSLGVFCLSEAQREDISADYLTNYRMPFLSTGSYVNSSSKACVELLQNSEQSTWVIENPSVSGRTVTGFYVNKDSGDALALTLKELNFDAELADHKLYQTVKLPAGYYVFGFEETTDAVDDYSYIVVAEGAGLPNTENLATEALASAAFAEGEVMFMLTEETEVSVGLLMNTRGSVNMLFKRFYLEKKESNDDFSWTSIDDTSLSDTSKVTVNVARNYVEISTVVPYRVSIYNVYGVLVYNAVVDGTRRIELPKGIYVIDGTKFVVR